MTGFCLWNTIALLWMAFKCLRMSSNVSVFLWISGPKNIAPLWWCISFVHMVISHPVFIIMHILYDWSLWLKYPLSTSMKLSPFFSLQHYLRGNDNRIIISVSYLLSALHCLATKVPKWSSSLSAFNDDLLITDIIPLIEKLNNSIAGMGILHPSGVDLACNKAGFAFALVSKHCLSICLMTLIHTSIHPLLWR